MFFQNWNQIFKIIILAVLFYISLVFILRISGKRTLADLNAFDLVVTITMGSIFSTTLLSSSTELFEGLTAILTLVMMQYIMSKISVYSKKFTKILKSSPTLLYYDGEFLEKNFKKTRVTKDDIIQQVRLEQGLTLSQISAVVLEPNGKLSVITNIPNKDKEQIESYK
ncbi:DUF421 domain-containing protein [Senegalia massiliensis]|uniref:DUF421 domain-containing protein n=1 Tax=Senegalia massiliensis TaxID=1720316 RepID=UPI0010327102|nr:YetF domain-containing protein [Senegalia massiliensis]